MHEDATTDEALANSREVCHWPATMPTRLPLISMLSNRSPRTTPLSVPHGFASRRHVPHRYSRAGRSEKGLMLINAAIGAFPSKAFA